MAIKRSWAYRAGLRCLVPAFLLAFVAAPSARAEESFEDLLANLKSPTARTRENAAEALGKTRRREAVAPLSALVRDPEPRVRMAVVDALRRLRDTSGVPALVTSLQDGDPAIRDQAISAIVEVYGDRERGGPIDRFLETFSDEYDRTSIAPYAAVDPAAYRGLAGALRDEKKNVRVDAAFAIGILGGRERLARPRRRPPGPRVGRARGGGDRARQGGHRGGGPGPHPAPRRRVDERAQPRDGRRRRPARQGRRPPAARDVRAEPPARAGHAGPLVAEPDRRPGAGRPLPRAAHVERPRAAPARRGGPRADRRRLDAVGVQDRLPAREERRTSAWPTTTRWCASATGRSSTASPSASAPGACARDRARGYLLELGASGRAGPVPLPQRSRRRGARGGGRGRSRRWGTRGRSRASSRC